MVSRVANLQQLMRTIPTSKTLSVTMKSFVQEQSNPSCLVTIIKVQAKLPVLASGLRLMVVPQVSPM